MVIINRTKQISIEYDSTKLNHYISQGFFETGVALVYQGKFGFIKKDGSFLEIEGNKVTDIKSNFPFNNVNTFSEGFYAVRVGKWGFLRPDGTYLKIEGMTARAFVDVDSFKDGFASVRVSDEKYNFINTKGRFLKSSEPSFAWTEDFKDGLANVRLHGSEFTYRYINKYGMLLPRMPYSFAFNDYFLKKVEENGNIFGYIFSRFYDRF